MQKNTSMLGFTIVELLIVIVVIAILAAVSIIGYIGIQGRAQNAQLLSAFDAYEKALRQYKALNDTYPMATDIDVAHACLGNGSPKAPLSTDICFISGGNPQGKHSNVLDTALASVITPLPSVNNQINFLPDRAANGLMYYRYVSPGYTTTQLFYLVRDNQQCGRGQKYNGTMDGVPYTSCTIIFE